MAEAQKPVHNTKPCDVCKKAGQEIQIWFDKIGTDPATGKNQWKLRNAKDDSEHVHVAGAQRKPSSGRIAEIIYQGSNITDINTLLKADRRNMLFAAVPSLGNDPVVYVVVRKEYS